MGLFSRRQNEEEQDGEQEQQAHKPTPPQQPIGFETIIGASSVLEGKLTSTGNVRLDGEFSGTLDVSANILVGETANINADIEARNISIAGAVRGNVTGNKVQLLRTGRIWGDINAVALTTEEGAFIDGKITMQGHAANNVDAETDAEPETGASAADDDTTAVVDAPLDVPADAVADEVATDEADNTPEDSTIESVDDEADSEEEDD